MCYQDFQIGPSTERITHTKMIEHASGSESMPFTSLMHAFKLGCAKGLSFPTMNRSTVKYFFSYGIPNLTFLCHSPSASFPPVIGVSSMCTAVLTAGSVLPDFSALLTGFIIVDRPEEQQQCTNTCD